jgi:ATP-dependent Lhr-like helicase
VLWAGHGGLSGADGWVSLHLADSAPLTLPEPGELELGPLHEAVVDVLVGGGAFFFRQLGQQLGSTDDAALSAAVWDLVWGGRLGNDTLAPLRGLTRSGTSAHRVRRTPPRARVASGLSRAALPTRGGPPDMAGRWFLLPEIEPDPTRRAHAAAEGLLDRHGVVTRGAVASERTPGGFAAAYRVLSTFEETGRCRRGYFVDGLGAAQFALPGAVDRLRAEARPDDLREPAPTWVLAATDPANPYGAALAWPQAAPSPTGGRGHQPARKAGALVVLVDGECVLYVERGGRTLLSFSDDASQLQPAADALALAVRDGALGKLQVERADGVAITASPLGDALSAAGFRPTPRGLRLRG